MFSLIISIISIALVAALAAATVYFGGAAFNKGSAGADASAFVNAGQQIAGAVTLASSDGYTITDLDDLVTGGTNVGGNKYLTQIPNYKGTPLDFDTTATNHISIAVQNADVCNEIVKRTGVDAPETMTATSTNLFTCIADTTSTPNVFKAYYKVK